METYPIINISVGKYKIRLRYATDAFVWFHIIDSKGNDIRNQNYTFPAPTTAQTVYNGSES
ncbi:hypothetical protein CON82_29195 [Bacillus wiedmannii]|nr:hypothetical protein CON82_29195 [Bacillus wiedmannii]